MSRRRVAAAVAAARARFSCSPRRRRSPRPRGSRRAPRPRSGRGAPSSPGASTRAARARAGTSSTARRRPTAPARRRGARATARRAVDVTEQLRGLETGATYHYRVVASNGVRHDPRRRRELSRRRGARRRDGPASALGPSSATVGGTVDPNGRSTGWWIEYGTRDELRVAHRHAVRGAGASPVGVSRAPRAAPRGGRVPLPGRRVERPRHRARRRPVVPHRSGPDRRRRAASTPSRSPRRALSGIVDPRDRGTAAWFEYGTTRRSGAVRRTRRVGSADARLRPARRACSRGRATTTASSPGATPARPPGDALVLDERRPARDDGRAAGLRRNGRADRERRPGRPLDRVVVRARPDHRVRDVDRRARRGLGARRGRRLGDDRRARAGRRVPRPARRAELGGDDARRRRGLPHGGRPRRRRRARVRDSR